MIIEKDNIERRTEPITDRDRERSRGTREDIVIRTDLMTKRDYEKERDREGYMNKKRRTKLMTERDRERERE